MEQLGEKQDFEAELSRLGFRHEHFVLHVVRSSRGASGWESQDYTVTVENVVTQRQGVYQSGPGKGWVQECARDLGTGLFGNPARKR
jgi:hypothetical protein